MSKHKCPSLVIESMEVIVILSIFATREIFFLIEEYHSDVPQLFILNLVFHLDQSRVSKNF